MSAFIREKRELKYKGSMVDFYTDTIRVPNGNIVNWDYVHHKGAVAILPITKEGKIVLVKQWRNALDQYIYEIPAGGLNESGMEDTCKAALRELREETGYISGRIEKLFDIYTSVAFCNEKISIFIAEELSMDKQELDEDEFIQVFEFTTKELQKMIYQGEIQDVKTISAILAWINKLS